MKKFLIFITLIISFSCINLFAEDVSVLSVIDKEEITIGDRVTYALKIFMADKVKDVFLTQDISLDPFKIKDFKVYEHENLSDGRIMKRVDYVLTVYRTGDLKIPSIIIKYLDKQGKEHEIKSEEISIKVKSVIEGKLEDVKDIKEIKDLFDIKVSWLKRIFVGMFIILGILLIIIGVKYWMYKRNKSEKNILEKLKNEEDIAYEELKKLEQENLLNKGNIKEYYFKLSDIIKKYLEKRYEILAVEYTTTEIVLNLKNLKIGMDKLSVIHGFLDESDLVKFAKWIPEKDKCEDDFVKAKDIVDKTKKDRDVEISTSPKNGSSQ